MVDAVQHQPIDYTERDCGVFHDGFVVDRQQRRLAVTGRCPACGGQSTCVFVVGSPEEYKGRSGPEAEPQPPAEPTTVICACGYPHPLRPAESDEIGCGAYWKIDLA
jgi:hypothetical protein